MVTLNFGNNNTQRRSSYRNRNAQPLGMLGKTLFLVIGCGAIIGSFFAFRSSQYAQENGIKTASTVIDVVQSRDSDGNTNYYPVVKATHPESNVALEQKLNMGGSSKPRIGSTIDVLLVEKNGNIKIQKDGFMGLWFLPLFLFLFGGIFSAVPLLANKKQASIEPNRDNNPYLQANAAPEVESIKKQIKSAYRAKGLSESEIAEAMDKFQVMYDLVPPSHQAELFRKVLNKVQQN